MTCHACTHYQSTAEALKPRPGLDGYGYCKAAPTIELRSRMFADTSVCWLTPAAFKERK